MPRLNSLNKRSFTRRSFYEDYWVTPLAATVNEGSTVTVTANTKGLANGTILYWTLTGNVVSGDLTGGATSGSFTINGNLGSFSVTLASDFVAEGSESMAFQIRKNSTSGQVVAVTTTTIVADYNSFTAEYLIVAGGGGSGANGGGGGGAGGLLTGNISIVQGTTYPFVIGAGGGYFSQGSDSTGFGLTAIGGGRGANRDGPGAEATVGGSGGGGSAASGPGSQESGRAGTPGQGYSGGNGVRSIQSGGGGGGAGGPGGNWNGTTGGNGGNGFLSNISGTPAGYAGGGAGSGLDYGPWDGRSGDVHYAGGIWYGGGGWQTKWTLGQRDGGVNTGGGGGGLGDGGSNPAGQGDSGGGSGGSGIVIIRWPDTFPAAASFTANCQATTTGGFRIYKFTGSGSITV